MVGNVTTSPRFVWQGGKSSGIMIAESVISADVCNGVVAEFTKHYDKLFTPGPVIGGHHPAIKYTMDSGWSKEDLEYRGIPGEPLCTYEKLIVDGLWASIANYRETFRWLWDWPGLSDTGFRVQHYAKNIGYYREHIDGGIGPRTTSTRILGAIIYLNTVEVGGGTYFREHDIMVPAKIGSVSLFPAHWTHPHQGCVPISNDKWIISSFITMDTGDYDQQIETGNESLS